jgi:polyisoprenoid-binding protein YceI
VYGDLTIRDVTREVVLDTEFDGRTVGLYGKEVAAFTATTELNRKDFGLRWNALLETGGAVVGDRVKVTLHIEAVRQS